MITQFFSVQVKFVDRRPIDMLSGMKMCYHLSLILQYLHTPDPFTSKRVVVHRDIKPENILVSDSVMIDVWSRLIQTWKSICVTLEIQKIRQKDESNASKAVSTLIPQLLFALSNVAVCSSRAADIETCKEVNREKVWWWRSWVWFKMGYLVCWMCLPTNVRRRQSVSS